MWARIFAVFAAIFLVSAVALMSLAPMGLTLGNGLAMFDGTVDLWLRQHSPAWLRQWVEVPLLIRPVWLLPAALGLICAGLAVSCSLDRTSASRRRRS